MRQKQALEHIKKNNFIMPEKKKDKGELKIFSKFGIK